jgi:Cu/Ag efflux protein CusF
MANEYVATLKFIVRADSEEEANQRLAKFTADPFYARVQDLTKRMHQTPEVELIDVDWKEVTVQHEESNEEKAG